MKTLVLYNNNFQFGEQTGANAVFSKINKELLEEHEVVEEKVLNDVGDKFVKYSNGDEVLLISMKDFKNSDYKSYVFDYLLLPASIGKPMAQVFAKTHLKPIKSFTKNVDQYALINNQLIVKSY